jgi:hypothetical protein
MTQANFYSSTQTAFRPNRAKSLGNEHFIEKQKDLKIVAEVTMFLNQWTTNSRLVFSFLYGIFNAASVGFQFERMRGVF